jgi:hypothetical protein
MKTKLVIASAAVLASCTAWCGKDAGRIRELERGVALVAPTASVPAWQPAPDEAWPGPPEGAPPIVVPELIVARVPPGPARVRVETAPPEPYVGYEKEPTPVLPAIERPAGRPVARPSARPLRPVAPARPGPTPLPSPEGPDPAVAAAVGIGIAGLLAGTVTAGIALDEPTDGRIAAAGVGLGIGLVALATAGIIVLTTGDDEEGEQDEAREDATARLRVGAGSVDFDVEF